MTSTSSHSRTLDAWVLLLLIAFTFAAGCVGPGPAVRIENPYAGVNWERHGQYKANLHTHTKMSDGQVSPAGVIDLYRDLDYTILALTDHDHKGPVTPTWPWAAHGKDPAALGMVAIEGNEISRVHHMGSYFNDYGKADLKSQDEAIEEIGRRGGLAVLFHPGRYKKPVDWYVDLYRRYDQLIGLEVFNQGGRYPLDRRTWDAILTALPAGRPIWGFSNDDMHRPAAHLGRSWNVFILPALSGKQVRRAMERGRFYFVNAPQGHAGPAAPVIQAIAVDRRSGTIRVQTAGQETVEWICEGVTVFRGNRLSLTELPAVNRYVRAEIHGTNGIVVGTQPFRIRRKRNAQYSTNNSQGSTDANP